MNILNPIVCNEKLQMFDYITPPGYDRCYTARMCAVIPFGTHDPFPFSYTYIKMICILLYVKVPHMIQTSFIQLLILLLLTNVPDFYIYAVRVYLIIQSMSLVIFVYLVIYTSKRVLCKPPLKGV